MNKALVITAFIVALIILTALTIRWFFFQIQKEAVIQTAEEITREGF